MEVQNYISGEFTAATNTSWIANVNPADEGDVIGQCPNSTPDDASAAVTAAANALPAWAALPAPTRGEYIRKAADILEARADTVAADLTREEGKSLPEARGETLRSVAILRYYAAETMRPTGTVIPSMGATPLFYTRRVPLGVCALITPWNFPIAIPVWKAAPALACGNTVVLKPSELTPVTANHLAECLHQAKLPAGVFNVLHGTGAQIGEALVTHTKLTGVSFTGSVRAGRTIAAWAAQHGKKCQLEMGGQNAAIIMNDANLEQAVTLTLQGAFKSAGQKCTATSRAIIHKDVYNQVEQMLVERTSTLNVGPGTDPDAWLGPVISRTACRRVFDAIKQARSSGIRVLCGGAPEASGLACGFYVLPTILADVPPDAAIAQEEVFGPLLCLMKADSLDHAIDIANGVEYGLSASVFTTSLDSALTFADRVEAGMVRINGETAGVEPQAPFGGMKSSSSFSRELGEAAREFYTQTKTISIDRAQ